MPPPGPLKLSTRPRHQIENLLFIFISLGPSVNNAENSTGRLSSNAVGLPVPNLKAKSINPTVSTCTLLQN